MEVRKDAVIINLSRAQRKLLKAPECVECLGGTKFQGHGPGGRLHIPVSQIESLISRFKALQADTSKIQRPNASPKEVIEQIILKITEARDSQKRTYPSAPGNSN